MKLKKRFGVLCLFSAFFLGSLGNVQASNSNKPSNWNGSNNYNKQWTGAVQNNKVGLSYNRPQKETSRSNAYNYGRPYNSVFPGPCTQIKLEQIPDSRNFQVLEIKSFPDYLRPSRSGVNCALFAPDDNIISFLTGMIRSEKKSIKMAAYVLTHNDVIEELIKAKKRNIETVLVLDETDKNSSCVKRLARNGIDTYIYKQKSKFDIMHHKFIVFCQNVFDKAFTWTGSFNFTYPACQSNQENVVISDNQNLIHRFSNQFEKIKTNLCNKYKISNSTENKGYRVYNRN